MCSLLGAEHIRLKRFQQLQGWSSVPFQNAALAIAPRAAHILAHVKRNCHNPEQNILQSPRAREHVKSRPSLITLQAVQHKSLRNPSVFQCNMVQMFCPRAFVEITRKQFDFNVCVQITRSHITSRYIRVGLACIQGMNNYQNNTIMPYHAGHRNPYIAIGFLSSSR